MFLSNKLHSGGKKCLGYFCPQVLLNYGVQYCKNLRLRLSLSVGRICSIPDLQVHDDLPLVHILCVNFHPVHSQGLQKQKMTKHTHVQKKKVYK